MLGLSNDIDFGDLLQAGQATEPECLIAVNMAAGENGQVCMICRLCILNLGKSMSYFSLLCFLTSLILGILMI